MKKIILSIIVLSALASCKKGEEQSLELDVLSAVSFTSGISPHVSGTTWEASDQIGVFMYATDLTDLYDYYGSNVLYTISSGAGSESAKFSSENPLYYPQGASMDFVAYYPYTTEVSSTAISINTTDQSSEAKMNALDLMVARATNCSEETSPTLTFSRKMSKVVFEVSRKDNAVDEKLYFTLSNVVSDGTLAIVNSSEISVSKGTTKGGISLFVNDGEQVEAIIVPQTTTDAKIDVSFLGYTYTKTFSETFEAGKVYTYTLIVGQTGVEISGVTISDWGEYIDSGDLTITNATYYASEIDAENVPTSNKWTIIDEGEMTKELMEGVVAALNVAKDDGRSISISMPNATEIGDYAFSVVTYYDEGRFTTSGCPALTEIELPNVTTIGDSAFACSGLTSFNFEGVTEIGEAAFGSCYNLSEVINFSLTSIPVSAFSNCGFTSFDFAGVTEGGEQAFAGNTSLTEITNFEISTIPYGLFLSCSLTSFDFTWVTEIGGFAFGSCSALTEIELPATVTLIGEYAFWGCWDLTTVTLNWTGDEILAYDSSWFMDANKLSKIYIPNGTTADYVAKGWPEDLLVEKAQ